METSILFPSDPYKISEKDILHLHPFSSYNSNTFRSRQVWVIVAMGKGGAIGREGTLPWRLSEDLRHFKDLTMGHPVIMGRKTWESLPKRPLPGRRNIVVSRNPEYKAEGAEVFTSVEEAIESCREIPFIIGGEQIYNAVLPYATRLYLTNVYVTVDGADAFFPVISDKEWDKIEESDTMISSSGLRYSFVTLNRK